MSTARIAEALVAPARGLAAAADRRSWVAPLAAATLASALVGAVAVPRIDFERGALEELDRDPQAAQQPSPHAVEEKLAQARKVGAATRYAAALVGPALAALGASLVLAVAFRVAGARPPFAETFAVVSWGLLPLALRSLLLLPALLRMRGVAPHDVERALPSSLGALLPVGAPERLAAPAHALDLFALWAAALVALGMAHVAGASRGRAFAVVLALWVSYVLVARVALPGLMGGGR
jgi:hypothetical protein